MGVASLNAGNKGSVKSQSNVPMDVRRVPRAWEIGRVVADACHRSGTANQRLPAYVAKANNSQINTVCPCRF